jgi:hypothetical protein
MTRSLSALWLLFAALLLGCSVRYSPDDLRPDLADAAGAVDGAAGGDADGGAPDAAPGDGAPDAAAPECEIAGEDCGEDDFVECTVDLTCEPCGDSGQPCCQEGAMCRGLAGLVCTDLLCL